MKYKVIQVGANWIRAVDRGDPFSADFSSSPEEAQAWANKAKIPVWRGKLILPSGNDISNFYMSEEEADVYRIEEIKNCSDYTKLAENTADGSISQAVRKKAYERLESIIANLMNGNHRKNIQDIRKALPALKKSDSLYPKVMGIIREYEKRYYAEEAKLWSELNESTNKENGQDLAKLLEYLESGMHFEEFTQKAKEKLRIRKNELFTEPTREPQYCWKPGCVREGKLGRLQCRKCGWVVCVYCGSCSKTCDRAYPPSIEDRLEMAGIE